MTFRVEHGQGVFDCDTCSDCIECDGRSDFTGALIYARQEGWKTYKGPDGLWAHACPSCAEDWSEKQRLSRT